MRWSLSHRFDSPAREIADRHYNRQSVGSPQFVPPGRCIVLVIPASAFWVTSWPLPEYVKHAWPGAWVCSAFRNEDRERYLSSELVLEGIAATRWFWTPPEFGMITFIDPAKTKHKRDPGRCFRKAGFVEVGLTKRNSLVALQLLPSAMPPPEMPIGANLRLAL